MKMQFSVMSAKHMAATLLVAASCGAFAFQNVVQRPSKTAERGLGMVGIGMPGQQSLAATRDVYSMEQWARGYGVQSAPGLEIYQTTSGPDTLPDGSTNWLALVETEDYGLRTTQPITAGEAVMFVPAQMVLSSSAIQQEFAGSLEQSEHILIQEYGAGNRLPLFRLMVKILVEYENGEQSPYYPWLNSMPQMFFNGVAMTDACFECLPPYVGSLAFVERENFRHFFDALNRGNLPLSSVGNEEICKWAYNVALTRHQVVIPEVEKRIAPLADMLNHGTFANVDIAYDDEANCIVTATKNIEAGASLTVSLGDPSNPSPLFAVYGFLDNDCPGIFCKAISHVEEMIDLGYGYEDLLFGRETGEIGGKVYDVFLYKLLKDNNDPNAQAFLQAVQNKKFSEKQKIADQYFPYTLEALKQHVDEILALVERLTEKANSFDLDTHPRVPVIVAHNQLVKETFQRVQAQLYRMG